MLSRLKLRLLLCAVKKQMEELKKQVVAAAGKVKYRLKDAKEWVLK